MFLLRCKVDLQNLDDCTEISGITSVARFFYTHSFASRPELMDENSRPYCIDPIRKRVVPF